MDANANQKVSCVANYVYEASETDELSIRPGDVLRDVERLPGGWWRGELRGRRGMFPDNFVTVLTDQGNARPSGAQGRCRAVFSYQPANPDELPLCVGDVLEVLGEVEEGWWQGRRQGRVGVFPSNFVVMLDPTPAPPSEPAPALPPKPVKEMCRVLFPYTAVNEDELTLAEGELVTLVSKEAPDRGWWRGELRGKVGLFPDNFVQIVPNVAQEAEEKKPDRPSAKSTNNIYPVLNKYSEKTASVKELTTTRISMHKENSLSKENSTHSTVTHTNKSESEKLVHNETVTDGSLDGQIKKPPVPLKKSPTPSTGVGGLFSGLKSKMMSTTDKEKSTTVQTTVSSSASSSSGEWDRPDGGGASKPRGNTNTNTFDHVERNSLLNDPRVGRVKAPKRRPPSQALRDDTLQIIGLSNGHEVPTERPATTDKSPTPADKSSVDKTSVDRSPSVDQTEEIKPRTRDWGKQKAPWMEELKLNQAKKTSFGSEGKSRSVSGSSESSSGLASKAGGGSTDRILDVGVEEKRSTHSMEMSKSTSSISSRMSVLESFEEKRSTEVRHSLDSKKDPAPREEPPKAAVTSPTAAGRTLTSMLDEVKKPMAPSPPTTARSSLEPAERKTPEKHDKTSLFEKTTTIERIEKDDKIDKIAGMSERTSTIERRMKTDTTDSDVLIAQLNNRILNLEKLLEVQNAKFNAAIEELHTKLALESEKRIVLHAELAKLSHCVTQV